MIAFLTVVHVIVCFILILVILLQAGRGQGFSGAAFGTGNVQTLFGTRAGDFLSKATSVAAICFLLTSIGLDFIEVRKSRSLLEGPRQTNKIDLDTIKRALEQAKQEGAAAEKTPAAPKTETAPVKSETPAAPPPAPAPTTSAEKAPK